jgi:hypothetical protein
MGQTFCAALSQAAREEMVCTAPGHLSYVLIECPHPWAPQDMESKGIPQNLRDLVASVKSAKLPVRFLLFTGEQSGSSTRILLFRRQERFSSGYLRRELRVDAIAEVAPLLSEYLTEDGFSIECQPSEIQDYFVCTHGSHDKCCAHYGYPFYRKAKAIADSLEQVRVWQVSHIGGHRFAPTVLSLPDGRYYGALDEEAFAAIAQRKGDINALNWVYRGWGILPKQAQVVEREILLQHGWEFMQSRVICSVTEDTQVQLCYETPEGLIRFTAEVFEDESKTQHLIGSCGQTEPSKFIKYSVRNLRRESDTEPYRYAHRPSLEQIPVTSGIR